MTPCHCTAPAVTTWRTRPVCVPCLIRCVRQAVAKCEPGERCSVDDVMYRTNRLGRAQDENQHAVRAQAR
jgi:hypothetical protein